MANFLKNAENAVASTAGGLIGGKYVKAAANKIGSDVKAVGKGIGKVVKAYGNSGAMQSASQEINAEGGQMNKAANYYHQSQIQNLKNRAKNS